MTAEALIPAETSQPAFPATLQRIVLTGFMGSGKTSVGRLLASALGWQFLDLDDHLEARTGTSISELFTLHGEPRFRRLESSALANALIRTRTVLALGGGTPELLTNRLLLEQTPGTMTVLLQAPFEILFDRCMLQSFASPEHIRPVLGSPAEAEQRFRAREPLYRRLAALTLETSTLSPAQVASTLTDLLARRADYPHTSLPPRIQP